MKPKSLTFTVTALVACLLLPTQLTHAALADNACDASLAAGKPNPPAAKRDRPDRFRIFWHVATQIEDIADAPGNEAAIRDIEAAARLADGFYFNALLDGPMIYWPDRPKVCELNFKRVEANDRITLPDEEVDFPEGGEGGRASCKEKQAEFLAGQPDSTDTPAEIQMAALRRVASVLSLESAQASGKPIWGENIIRNTDFTYDKAADKVILKNLPTTYCVMNSLGITLNEMMLYQEPASQTKKGNFLWIPQKRENGKLRFSKNARRDKIPENPHAFSLVAQSIRDAGLPASGLRVNVRRTRASKALKMFPELEKVESLSGYNFEGGTVLVEAKKENFDLLIDNAAWILKNTDREISMLMPGYWTRTEIDTVEELDGLIERMRQLVVNLNTRLSEKMALPEGENALCNDRIVLIPASYGKPLRVKTLPMYRSEGKLAATVTGQIKLLDGMRREMCGS
jgi:hypothetical protein